MNNLPQPSDRELKQTRLLVEFYAQLIDMTWKVSLKSLQDKDSRDRT